MEYSRIGTLRHKIGEKTYQLFCDEDSPTIEVKEALCQFTAYVMNIENKAKEAQEAEQAKPVPVPEDSTSNPE